MTTLRDFLSNRRSEIHAQIRALRAELREIDAASAAVQESPGSDGSRTVASGRRSSPTLKEMAIAVLADHPDGLEANDVRDRIAERFGSQVKRESMSPQLSRLARDGVIRRGGHNKWLLKALSLATVDQNDGDMAPDNSEGEDVDLPS